MAGGRASNLLQFALTFLLLYFGSQFLLQMFFPDTFGPQSERVGLFLSVQDDTVKGGHHPVLMVNNKTNAPLALPDRCPQPPVDVYRLGGEEPIRLTATGTVLPCEPLTEVPAGEKVTIDLAPWKYALFGEFGQYTAELPMSSGALVELENAQEGDFQTDLDTEFSLEESGPITQIFRTFVTKPLLNALILIAEYAPGHDLGLAIIILTVLVKLILFLPTQHAMEGQRKLQKVQPQLDAIRKKHKSNPEKMNKEIMALWKREGVNPLQSCLPTLIQFPVLIGLFFVIRDGSILALSQHLVYPPFQDLAWTWDVQFLGLNLLEPSKYIFPPLLVALQFSQMKLTFAIANKKKTDTKAATPDSQLMQQRMMTYGLPLLIGVFAFQFPAAVSLYWAVSTVFAIGQQVVVNRRA